MCGVIGYVGEGIDVQFLYNSLKKLEYRGYDSAGIAVIKNEKLFLKKSTGKLSTLEPHLHEFPSNFSIGIGHTRWATHGKPSLENAHPHTSGNMVLLHNGIIENYLDFKSGLLAEGYRFLSETDTESAVHLLNREYKNSLEVTPFLKMKSAFVSMISKIKGAYAFVVMNTEIPDCLFVAKMGSPLVIATGQNAHYVASGITAVVEQSQNVVILEDGDIGIVKKDSLELFDVNLKTIVRPPIHIEWNVSMMEKEGFKHFMLKEIHEHPISVSKTLLNLFSKQQNDFEFHMLGIDSLNLSRFNRVLIMACGTSYIAGLLSKYYLENWLQIPVEVELASEFRYRNPFVCEKDFIIAISQSGETADTIQAIKLAKSYNPFTLAVVNVPGSSLSHICNKTLHMNAGPEIGVASTKSFTCQLVSLMILGLAMSKKLNKLNDGLIYNYIENLFKVPSHMEFVLGNKSKIYETAIILEKLNSLLFLGRGPNWALALEGALKFKELSYIHAEAYPGGELKHGPIALIDENMLAVVIAPQDRYREKIASNIQEIKARGGQVVVIGMENDEELKGLAHVYIPIQSCPEINIPFLIAVVLHKLAYWVAELKGNDVDQPRNLAKSVTVE